MNLFHKLKLFFLSFQAGSSPVSSISGFSVGSGRVDEAVDDFKVIGTLRNEDCNGNNDSSEKSHF